MNLKNNQNYTSPKKGLTFLIPALNEEESIGYTIKLCKRFIKKNPKIPCEILVCDNGSEDKTVFIAKKLKCNVIIENQKGYGINIINGIKNSQYNNIIFGDADGSYDFSDSLKFYNLLEKGFDLVMGNRFSKIEDFKMEKKSMRFLHKYLGNPVLSLIARSMFQIKVTDFNCGLRALKKNSFNNGNIFLCKGMEFATEVVAVASKLGLKVTEVPIKLYADKRKNASAHLNTWRDGWRHLKFILAMSHSKIFINFAIIFLLINFGFHLFYLFREIFQINLLTNLNLVTSLFLNALSYVGLNLIILSIFLSRTIRSNYNFLFPQNEKIQNILTKIESDTYFKLSGIFLLIIFYSIYFLFGEWRISGYNFLDLNSKKITYHILIFSQSIPILLFLIKMGFINYLVKK
jgi:glycosyltransferase involved in cell wall biosynthesis